MSQQSVSELHDKGTAPVHRLLKRLFQRLKKMLHETKVEINVTFLYSQNAYFAPFHRENRLQSSTYKPTTTGKFTQLLSHIENFALHVSPFTFHLSPLSISIKEVKGLSFYACA